MGGIAAIVYRLSSNISRLNLHLPASTVHQEHLYLSQLQLAQLGAVQLLLDTALAAIHKGQGAPLSIYNKRLGFGQLSHLSQQGMFANTFEPVFGVPVITLNTMNDAVPVAAIIPFQSLGDRMRSLVVIV